MAQHPAFLFQIKSLFKISALTTFRLIFRHASLIFSYVPMGTLQKNQLRLTKKRSKIRQHREFKQALRRFK